MKEVYESPKMMVSSFDQADVITASGGWSCENDTIVEVP